MSAAAVNLYCEQGAAITCTYQWANASASNSLLVTNASLSKIR